MEQKRRCVYDKKISPTSAFRSCNVDLASHLNEGSKSCLFFFFFPFATSDERSVHPRGRKRSVSNLSYGRPSCRRAPRVILWARINDPSHVGQFANRISSSNSSKGVRNARKQTVSVDIRWALFYIFDVAERDLSMCLVQTREKLICEERNKMKYYFRLRFISKILWKSILKNWRGLSYIYSMSHYVNEKDWYP